MRTISETESATLEFCFHPPILCKEALSTLGLYLGDGDCGAHLRVPCGFVVFDWLHRPRNIAEPVRETPVCGDDSYVQNHR